ncbi:hypothetical protein ACJX0J_042055, partial [Zea mays]
HSDQGQVLYFISKIIEFLLHYNLLLVIRDHVVGESSVSFDTQKPEATVSRELEFHVFLFFFLSIRSKFAQNGDGNNKHLTKHIKAI